MSGKRQLSDTTSRILKALSVFGGVQVITILCSIVRTKLVALWLGPLGVGLISIYNQTVDLFNSTSQLNLRQSAVRDISARRDTNLLGRTLGTVRVLSIFLGAVGTLAMIILSPLLSYFSFGDYSQVLPFIILSPVLFFSAIGSGESAAMQGLERLQALARSTLYSALTATVAAVPLFFFFRIHGIVPVLLVFAVCNCIYTIRLGTGYRLDGIGLRTALREGRPMLSLGFYMTVSSLVTLLASYVFTAYLSRVYSTETVGFYQAGYTLVNSYVGLIFTSISMEFYPRLSSVAKNPWRTNTIVSHEITVALWVLVPVVVSFICLRGLIVDILYTEAFDAILPYLAFGIIGVFLRATSWCVAYVMLARGDGKVYIITEAISAAAYLGINIPFFIMWGFKGLGIAYVLWYAVYLAAVYAIYRLRYGLRLASGVWRLLLAAIAFGAVTLVCDWLVGGWWALAVLLPPALWIAYRRITGK